MEQLVYQLEMSTEGAGNHIVLKGVLWTIVPSVVSETLLVFVITKVNRHIFSVVSILVLGISFVCFGIYSWNRLSVGEYLTAIVTYSDFIEEQYVDPDSVTITFPEQKRNLIYIYLESMEITYADNAAGGAFKNNVISELTELAVANEDFSGEDDTLNGGNTLSGATWTIAGMFAQTAGLPLKIGISDNSMDSQSNFFPSITTLGDILEAEDYKNVLMIGSEATFAGRDHYFSSHGNYEIMDYTYAVDNSWILHRGCSFKN
jgi:phosphoglycerol transferase